MKKYLILLISGVLAATAAGAQNRSINFEQVTLEQAVEMAAASGRLVFMDCYTDWCGPCKMLEKNVFTRDSVADYFNARFVNIRVDMEKGEGPALAARYGVKAFPTMLFIGPDGRAVHTAVGYMEPARLLEQAAMAVDPALNTAAIVERFARGDRDPAFLREYIRAMSDANMAAQANEAAIAYLTPLMSDFETFATAENWDIFEMAVTDPYSGVFGLMMEYRPFFEQTVGKARVDDKIGAVLDGAVYALAGFPGAIADYAPADYDRLVAFLKTADDPRVPGLLMHLYLCDAARRGDYTAMVALLRDAIGYNIFHVYGPVNGIVPYLGELGRSERPDEQRLIVGFLEEILPQAPFPLSRATILRLLAATHDALGDTAAAAEASHRAAQEEQRAAKEPGA
jgi:thioredoxin-related protein